MLLILQCSRCRASFKWCYSEKNDTWIDNISRLLLVLFWNERDIKTVWTSLESQFASSTSCSAGNFICNFSHSPVPFRRCSGGGSWFLRIDTNNNNNHNHRTNSTAYNSQIWYTRYCIMYTIISMIIYLHPRDYWKITLHRDNTSDCIRITVGRFDSQSICVCYYDRYPTIIIISYYNRRYTTVMLRDARVQW